MSRDIRDLHLVLRDRFKDLMAAYVSGDRGRGLASSVAVYYEAMEDHVEDEERSIFTEILGAVSKTGIGQQVVEQMFEEIEENLGEGVPRENARTSQ